MTKRCAVCGKYFDTTKTDRFKYCSEECSKKQYTNSRKRHLFILERINMPMQVELEGDGYSDGELVYDYGKCPKCGWEFEDGDKDWEEPYCCHCGQKLHWFESEEEE